MEAKLKLVRFDATAEGTSAKGPWRKGIVVFETLGDYPKTIAINFFNSHLEEVRKLKEGDICKVKFDIASREYNKKWYTDINGFAVEAEGQQPAPQPQQKQEQTQPKSLGEEFFGQDDLPF